MPKRSPIPLAYKLRTATMATDYKGTHAGGLELLFVALPDALARRKMLDALEKVHVKMLARESGPELDGDQQTAAQVAALGHQVHPDSALPSLTPAGHAARLATSAEPLPLECPALAAPNGRHRWRGGSGAFEHCEFCGAQA